MRGESRIAWARRCAIFILMTALLASAFVSGCGNGSEPTKAESAAHEAKKKDPNK